MKPPAAALLPALLAFTCAAAEFYVAPNGSDSNTGTLAKPFATLSHARDEVRKSIAAGLHEDITVFLRGGTYRLNAPVVFGLQDSGTAAHPVTYTAYRQEEPVLSGGVTITGWKKLNHPPAGLPPIARGKVWVADVPTSLPRFYSLYDTDGPLPRARSEGFVPLTPPGEAPEPTNPEALRTLYYPPGVIRNWPNLDDVEVVIRNAWWTMNILALESVDETARVARTQLPGTYPLRPLAKVWYFPIHPVATAWVENVIEALDSPGEWVLDTHAKKLYLWPRAGVPDPQTVAPALRELIRVEGQVDANGPTDIPAHDLAFVGLTFQHADRDLWTNRDRGMQHDWEMEDKPDALLRFRGARNCRVSNCRFGPSGGNAIRLDYYAQQIRVEGNEMSQLGQGGVILFGYGPGTKDVNKHNEIIDNHIHHSGLLYWHSHAIVLWQSGDNHVAHNYIHDMPRKAVCLSGARYLPYFVNPTSNNREVARTFRWFEIGEPPKTWQQALKYLHTRNNIVEDNEVARVVQKLSDGAAMNISGAGEGNIFRHNYLHDIFGEEAPTAVLRNDDWQIGSVWDGNLIVRSNTLFAENKGRNDVVNNIVVDMDSRRFPTAYFQAMGDHWDGARFEHNIFYDSKKTTDFFSYLPRGGVGPEVFAKVGFGNNLYYDARSDKSTLPKFMRDMRAQGIGTTNLFADPLFVDPAHDDYRLRPDSPALKLGIKAIDLRDVGLTADFPEKFRAATAGHDSRRTPRK